MRRAFAVEEYFSGVLGIDPNRMIVEAAAPTEYVASNQTAAGRSRNRSVALYLGAPRVNDCPPRSDAAVSTIDDYIELIRCAERVTRFSPRQMLAMLRQMYYGKDWSATSQTELWDKVIPCSLNLGNPKGGLGAELFGALWHSVNIQGQDVGHIFTGLEAMTCPQSTVSVSRIPIDLATGQMQN